MTNALNLRSLGKAIDGIGSAIQGLSRSEQLTALWFALETLDPRESVTPLVASQVLEAEASPAIQRAAEKAFAEPIEARRIKASGHALAGDEVRSPNAGELARGALVKMGHPAARAEAAVERALDDCRAVSTKQPTDRELMKRALFHAQRIEQERIGKGRGRVWSEEEKAQHAARQRDNFASRRPEVAAAGRHEILIVLGASATPMSKAQIAAARPSGMTSIGSQLSKLLDLEHIERLGNKFGAKYQITDAGRAASTEAAA